jgi:hypothetical protein
MANNTAMLLASTFFGFLIPIFILCVSVSFYEVIEDTRKKNRYDPHAGHTLPIGSTAKKDKKPVYYTQAKDPIVPPKPTFFGRFNGIHEDITGPEELDTLSLYDLGLYKEQLQKNLKQKPEKASIEEDIANKKAITYH